jgi:hypothetical protein
MYKLENGNFPKKSEHINNSIQKGSYEKKFESICIIGIGTLGGFLAKDLSYLETTKCLTLFDYDTVETENFKNTIYSREDLGKLKALAIRDKLNPNVNVISKCEEFIEDKNNIPKSDLVIDCRDFTYDRKDYIDARIYISVKNLIIDCRKNIKNDKHYEGKYLEKLSKEELQKASFSVSLAIDGGNIKDLIDEQAVLEIDLNYNVDITNMTNHLLEKIKNKKDLVYDYHSIEKKLVNLHCNYQLIIEENKKNSVILCIGDKMYPYFTKTIPINHFRTINDIIVNLSFINSLYFNSYIVSIDNQNNNFYIRLLPETGSA